jgi:hypothetical protein
MLQQIAEPEKIAIARQFHWQLICTCNTGRAVGNNVLCAVCPDAI